MCGMLRRAAPRRTGPFERRSPCGMGRGGPHDADRVCQAHQVSCHCRLPPCPADEWASATAAIQLPEARVPCRLPPGARLPLRHEQPGRVEDSAEEEATSSAVGLAPASAGTSPMDEPGSSPLDSPNSAPLAGARSTLLAGASRALLAELTTKEHGLVAHLSGTWPPQLHADPPCSGGSTFPETRRQSPAAPLTLSSGEGDHVHFLGVCADPSCCPPTGQHGHSRAARWLCADNRPWRISSGDAGIRTLVRRELGCEGVLPLPRSPCHLPRLQGRLHLRVCACVRRSSPFGRADF